jgi:hypothetical protein
LSFKLLLLLAVALGFFEGDAKFGDRSEGSGVRRRRCLNGNPPKRLKRRDRRMMSQLELLGGGELLCGGFYPRLSCCLQSDSLGLGRLENKVGTSRTCGCELWHPAWWCYLFCCLCGFLFVCLFWAKMAAGGGGKTCSGCSDNFPNVLT